MANLWQPTNLTDGLVGATSGNITIANLAVQSTILSKSLVVGKQGDPRLPYWDGLPAPLAAITLDDPRLNTSQIWIPAIFENILGIMADLTITGSVDIFGDVVVGTPANPANVIVEGKSTVRGDGSTYSILSWGGINLSESLLVNTIANTIVLGVTTASRPIEIKGTVEFIDETQAILLKAWGGFPGGNRGPGTSAVDIDGTGFPSSLRSTTVSTARGLIANGTLGMLSVGENRLINNSRWPNTPAVELSGAPPLIHFATPESALEVSNTAGGTNFTALNAVGNIIQTSDTFEAVFSLSSIRLEKPAGAFLVGPTGPAGGPMWFRTYALYGTDAGPWNLELPEPDTLGQELLVINGINNPMILNAAGVVSVNTLGATYPAPGTAIFNAYNGASGLSSDYITFYIAEQVLGSLKWVCLYPYP